MSKAQVRSEEDQAVLRETVWCMEVADNSVCCERDSQRVGDSTNA